MGLRLEVAVTMAVTMCDCGNDYGTLAIALNGGQDVLHNVSLTMYRNKRPTKRNNETDAFDYFPIMTRARKSSAGYCTVSFLSLSLSLPNPGQLYACQSSL